MSCGGMPSAGRGLEHEARDEREVLERLRQVRGGEQLVAAVALREQDRARRPTRCRRRRSAASCRARGGRSRGRSGSRARPAGRGARRCPSRAPAGCAPCRRGGRAPRRPSPRSRARPARARRSDPPRRLRGPRPGPSSLRQPNPYDEACSAITSCTASSGCPARPRRSSRSSPTRQPRGDHAAVAGLRGRHAAADRDARRRADRVPAAAAPAADRVADADRGVGARRALRRHAADRALPAVAPHARVPRPSRRRHGDDRHGALRAARSARSGPWRTGCSCAGTSSGSSTTGRRPCPRSSLDGELALHALARGGCRPAQ